MPELRKVGILIFGDFMYPHLRTLKDNFVLFQKYFILSDIELNLVKQVKKPSNKLGIAILIKCYQFLGYFPLEKKQIPVRIIETIGLQLDLSPKLFKDYKWKNRTYELHLGFIREVTGFTPYQSTILNNLHQWITESSDLYPSRNNIATNLLEKFRKIKMELPTEKEFGRLVNSLRNGYYDHTYKTFYQTLTTDKLEKLKSCLTVSENQKSDYSWLKKPSGKAGLNSILEEIEKLKYIQNLNINTFLFDKYNSRLLEQLYRRCRSKDAARLDNFKLESKYSLLICYLGFRQMEITDNIIKIFLELIRRIEKKSDKSIEKEFSHEIKKSYNKQNILKKLILAILDNPSGTIKDVVLPKVTLATLEDLANGFNNKQTKDFQSYKASTMRKKYRCFYRRMVKPILDALAFKSNNPKWDNLLEGIQLIHKYMDTQHIYYPNEEAIPYDLLTGKWEEIAVEENENGKRIIKHYFELCVLEKMERTLKCKEIWLEHSRQYQNPDKDLPENWEEKREKFYDRLNISIEVSSFVTSLQEDMTTSLLEGTRYFDIADENDVYIFHPAGGKRGFFRVPKIKKRESRPMLKEIHQAIKEKWGIIDLLDVLVEADRRVQFSRFFYTSGQREILTEQQIRERLLLVLFSLGTNIDLKRIHKAANLLCSYDDLLYFKNHYINPDSLREAIIGLTNLILEIRNPLIWGNTTSCASDGKQFGSWDQNLMADSNPHYRDPGIMVYWHIDRNAACIYSQIKNCNSSEISAMVEGLIRHATTMQIKSNYVDSRGQSEIAFAFCHFLGIQLMPRLKQIKKQKLYLPFKGSNEELESLRSVLNRPIRWKRIVEQYDEMVKYVSAIIEKPQMTESILRRFTSYNQSHPTYKAFLELGRACKTIFLCKYLTTKELRVEIHEGLNLVESWNSVNNFICFGNKSELQSNDPYTQEMIVLCLHLLQNSMILANTVMIDQIIDEKNLLASMTAQDKHSLNPLGTDSFNPYGGYNLSFDKPSFLEAA